MTTNNQEVTTNPEKPFRHLVLQPLLFYMFMTIGIIGMDAIMGDDTSLYLPFISFLILMVVFIPDASRDWGWKNSFKIAAVVTTVAMLFAFIYQLVVGEMSLLRIALYPAVALLFLFITVLVRALGKTAPIQFVKGYLAKFGASKWVQRITAFSILAAGLAISIFAFVVNRGQ